jgi:hypothetical protein
VELSYHLASGDEVKQYVSVPAEKRRTIFVNSIVGPEQDVAIKVDSNHPIVAERPIYFDYRDKWNGGTLSIGAEDPSTSWFFAEGTTRAGFEEWLCLLNPGDLEANVNIRYVFQDATTQTQDLLLAPGQRFSVFVNEVVGPDRDVSIWVESDQGVVAERSLYFSYHEAWDGGHNALGVSP